MAPVVGLNRTPGDPRLPSERSNNRTLPLRITMRWIPTNGIVVGAVHWPTTAGSVLAAWTLPTSTAATIRPNDSMIETMPETRVARLRAFIVPLPKPPMIALRGLDRIPEYRPRASADDPTAGGWAGARWRGRTRR